MYKNMDFQSYIEQEVKKRRQQVLANSDQLTLGSLISRIESIIEVHKGREKEATVRFDFEYLFPTDIDSWRGSYSELALNFTHEGKELTVTQFLALLKSAVGKEFTGYKG